MKRSKLHKTSKREIPKLHRKAQPIFNRWIVQRDKRCMHPNCSKTLDQGWQLQCSHFWNQGTYGFVRYDEENADTLCAAHHAANEQLGWEFKKQGEYRDWKIEQLGEERYKELENRAHGKGKYYFQWSPELIKEIIEEYE